MRDSLLVWRCQRAPQHDARHQHGQDGDQPEHGVAREKHHDRRSQEHRRGDGSAPRPRAAEDEQDASSQLHQPEEQNGTLRQPDAAEERDFLR